MNLHDGGHVRVEAEHYLIATGSTPRTDGLDGADRVDYLTSTTAIANGNATIEGVEFEGTIVPFDGLNLTATWSWIDAHYDKFIVPTIGDRTAFETWAADVVNLTV